MKIIKDMNEDSNLDTTEMLLMFLAVIMQAMYLLCLSLVLARRGRKLAQLKNCCFYVVLAVHCGGRLGICLVLAVQLAVGLVNESSSLTPEYVYVMFKNVLAFDDLSLLLLLILALQWYTTLSLRSLHFSTSPKHVWFWLLLFTLCALLGITFAFDLSFLSYPVIGWVFIAINAFLVLVCLSTLSYLSFTMTGLMLDASLCKSLIRLRRLLFVLIFSRISALAFYITIAVLVPSGSLCQYIRNNISNLSLYEVFAVIFVITLMVTLLSEGLPLMYSLRQSVVDAMGPKEATEANRSLITSANSIFYNPQETEPLSLQSFSDLHEMKAEHPLWRERRGWLHEEEFILRTARHYISNYIAEDIENEVARWTRCKSPPLSAQKCFYEGTRLWLSEAVLPLTLDALVHKQTHDSGLRTVALRLAEAVSHLHYEGLVHGALRPTHVFSNSSHQILINGYAEHSLKKYTALVSPYSDKGLYTAVEHLRERGPVPTKPTPASDVYSLGIILFEVLTRNQQYRELTLIDIQTKFSSYNFRPKLPENLDSRIKILIRNCWHYDPALRPSAAHIALELKAITLYK